MSKTYQVMVFGKEGCDKCKVLNQRLDKLMAKDEWQDFEKAYVDVMTEDGLVAFCKAECINPQRIPAFVVSRKNEQTGAYEPVPNPRPFEKDPVCKDSKLYTFMGLQTDYSGAGGGLITPKMISTVLEACRG